MGISFLFLYNVGIEVFLCPLPTVHKSERKTGSLSLIFISAKARYGSIGEKTMKARINFY